MDAPLILFDATVVATPADSRRVARGYKLPVL
jgi:hypothetical protein